jgi:hypothetical protein
MSGNSPRSWGEFTKQLETEKSGPLKWTKEEARNSHFPAKKTGRVTSDEFLSTFVRPTFDHYKKSTTKPSFHTSPLRSHYRRSAYNSLGENDTPEPFLRANEASKPWNLIHHHSSKHPDEPMPGGPGKSAQRSSIPFDIVNGSPLRRHPNWERLKNKPTGLTKRGRSRKGNIITHELYSQDAKDELVRAAMETAKFVETKGSHRRNYKSRLLKGTGTIVSRTPTQRPQGKRCVGTNESEQKSEGAAYNILNCDHVVDANRLKQFDKTANAGFRRVSKFQPVEYSRKRRHRMMETLQERRQHNRIALTRELAEKQQGGRDYSILTNKLNKIYKNPKQGMGGDRSLPVWERLGKSDLNTGVVARFGEFGGLQNRLGKADHCIVPSFQEKHHSLNIFPESITRREAIKERFGSLKKPSAFKPIARPPPSFNSPRKIRVRV